MSTEDSSSSSVLGVPALADLAARLKLQSAAALARLSASQHQALTAAASASDPTQPRLAPPGSSLLQTPIEQVRFAVFDVEATGLSLIADEIIELAVSHVVGGQAVKAFDSLIKPRIEVPPRIFELTQIDPQQLAAAPPLVDLFFSIQRALSADCLVAHNARRDVAQIQQVAWQFDPHWVLPVSFCTLKASRLLLPETEKFGLHALAERFSLPIPSHRAAADVRTTVELLHLLLERAREKGCRTLSDLLSLEEQKKQQQRSSFIGPLQIEAAPNGPGVYRIHDDQGQCLYVGYSRDVRRRLREHLLTGASHATAELVRRARSFETEATESALDAFVREREWIEIYRPKLNARNAEHGRLRFFRLHDTGSISLVAGDEQPVTGTRLLGPVVLARSERLVLRAIRDHFELSPRPNTRLSSEALAEKKAAVQRFLSFISNPVFERPDNVAVEDWELLTEVRRGLRRVEIERLEAERPFSTPRLVQGLGSSQAYALCIGKPTLALVGDINTLGSSPLLTAYGSTPPDGDYVDSLGRAIIAFAHRHPQELVWNTL